MGININYIANGVVTAISNNTIVQYYKFKDIDNSGLECINTYEDPITLSVQVQNKNRQTLRYSNGYGNTRIFKRIFINKKASGLDWSAQLGQDYFVMDSIVWYVVQVYDDFNNQSNNEGWVELTVSQSTDPI